MNFLNIFLLCFLIAFVNYSNANLYFETDQEQNQNLDDDFSSNEEIENYDDKTTIRSNDFKFDEQSNKDEETEKNQLYLFWNNIDMCNDVNCKENYECVINSNNNAICVLKNEIKKKKKRKKNEKIEKFESKEKNGKKEKYKNCQFCSDSELEDFYCSSNNLTYTSLCNLVEYNCKHLTNYYPICQGFCPCKEKQSENDKLKLDYLWKYINNFKISSIDLRKKNQKNDLVCSKKELNEMGQRLFSWFRVVLKNQIENENLNSKRILTKVKASLVKNCDEEVNWMFLNLDTNKDLKLSLNELYDLEHDEREKCLKQYIDTCDTNNDKFLNNNEWCSCFLQYRPCLKQKNKILNSNKLIKTFLPKCNKNGFYESLQCNKLTGFCWCVDKNGIEIHNTRTLGKINCEKKLESNKKFIIDDDTENDEDDDFEDYQTENEGSGD